MMTHQLVPLFSGVERVTTGGHCLDLFVLRRLHEEDTCPRYVPREVALVVRRAERAVLDPHVALLVSLRPSLHVGS